jgi:gliding motility-associated-like protein
VPNPLAVSPLTTDYRVTAVIGGCSTSGTIRVTTVPYPIAHAGPDTTICYNTPARLRGSTDGNSWRWSPAGSLSSAAVLNPVAWPPRTTDYILYTYDTRGCPKPGRDTVKVTVLPKMMVSAGNDTAVIINQPLQLHATGGEFYQWTPAFYLSATDIADPIAIFSEISGGLRYKVVVTDNNGCYDSAFINIKVFATGPTIFVPSAFTPNNDGKNDLLRPIAVGMKQIEYFRVFNRWGQMVFNTSVNGFGWDGRINGRLQGTNTYVWMVKAVDYTGQPYFRKGTVTLIH